MKIRVAAWRPKSIGRDHLNRNGVTPSLLGAAMLFDGLAGIVSSHPRAHQRKEQRLGRLSIINGAV